MQAGREEEAAALEQQNKLDLEDRKSQNKIDEEQRKRQATHAQMSALIAANPQWGIKPPPAPVTDEQRVETALATKIGDSIDQELSK